MDSILRKLQQTFESTIPMVAFALSLSACASTQVSLVSDPSGAKVYGKALGQGTEKYLGDTPLVIQANEIEVENDGSGPIILTFKKDGYYDFETLITELSAIDLQIQGELKRSSGLEDQNTLNKVVDDLFEAQRLAQVKRYDAALVKLQGIEKIAPRIAATYELQGGIFYIKRKYQEALDSFRTAVKYNPLNSESMRMINLIEKSFGITGSGSKLNLKGTKAPKKGGQ